MSLFYIDKCSVQIYVDINVTDDSLEYLFL